MFNDNIVQLRKLHGMTQEDLADAVGVTRQSVAQWESGKTCPNLTQSKAIADAFGVTLDDLANFEPQENLGLNVPPKGKHLFGLVTVGDKGQIVIPAEARKIFNIKPGDRLVVLGEEASGIAILKADDFLNLANMINKL